MVVCRLEKNKSFYHIPGLEVFVFGTQWAFDFDAGMRKKNELALVDIVIILMFNGQSAVVVKAGEHH